MLFKKCIGLACIARYNTIHDYKKPWIKHTIYSLQRFQMENPDETELFKEMFDVFDDDIIDTVWTNRVYFIEWFHHIH
jgi:ketopantoate reductase